MVVPLVEPESFDIDAASSDAAVDAGAPEEFQPDPAPSAESAPQAAPETTVLESGAPAAGAPDAQAPSGAEPDATPPTAEARTAPPGASAPNVDLRTGRLPRIAERTIRDVPEMRQKLEMKPGVLEQVVREKGVRVTDRILKDARESAEATLKVNQETAQSIGDEIARKVEETAAPKALQVRRKLNVDAALTARERAFNKLEEMGLSGVVLPEEGGQMRIMIGVDPTQFAPGESTRERIAGMQQMFAAARRNDGGCERIPSRARLQEDPVLATECVVKVLAESGEYEYVEKDYVFSHQMLRRPKKQVEDAALSLTPNDPLWSLQWNFKANGAQPGQSAGGAGFADFWNKAKLTGSRSVTVAVVDTGLQMSHPDIAGSPNIAKGFDMVSDPAIGNDGDGRDPNPNDPGDKCDPNDPTSSDSFHGTHVAGTIGVGATNNATGVAGGAWDVTIVPVRALGRCGGKLSDINDAIRWAAGVVPARDSVGNEVWVEQPADIINLSIGLFEPCPASMQAAINDAVAAGAIVVAAAGNARIKTEFYAPGGCANVISVGAGDERGQLTPYSNYGPEVDLIAPGGDMTRDDDGDGRPDGILSTKFSADCADPVTGKPVAQCFYSYENGTSMAAPHVAAALALLKARFPKEVPSKTVDRLMAATTARTPMQCSGKCSAYPGSEPIPDQDGMCFRPCGGKMLNLSNASVQ
ncbi:S8 family serine peptidase [bacterium]|nr:S8 family serine peptidase [bacterium]